MLSSTKENPFRIHQLSHILLISSLCIAMLGMRLPFILAIPILKFVWYLFFAFTAFIGFLSFFKINSKLSLLLLFFILLVFIQAICFFYQPSLRFGVPFQNYILEDSLSAHYMMAQTRLYCIFPVCFLFPLLSFHENALKGLRKKFYTKLFLSVLLISLGINQIIFFIQSFTSLNILTQGVTLAADAKRPLGLFADPGEGATIVSALTTFFIFSLLFLNLSTRIKYIFIGFSFLGIICAFLGNSRAYLICTLLPIILLLILYFIINLKYINNKIKIWFLFIGVLITSFIIFAPLSQLSKIRSEFSNSFNSSDGLFLAYSQIDIPRAKHLYALWINIKEHFPLGTGIGSFQEVLAQYGNFFLKKFPIFYDLPTNYYADLISSLGIVGLLFLIFFFFVIIKKLIAFFKRMNNTSSQQEIILFALPLGLVSSFFISQFIGYNLSFASAGLLMPLVILFSLDKQSYNILKKLLSFSIFWLIISIFYLAISAPQVPAFRWQSRNTPQVPDLGETQPIDNYASENEKVIFFKNMVQKFFDPKFAPLPKDAENSGVWLKSGAELLLNKYDYRIYISKNYVPLSIQILYMNKTNKKIKETQIIAEAGWLYFSAPQTKDYTACFSKNSAKSFCLLKIELEGSAFFSKYFYIERKFLEI